MNRSRDKALARCALWGISLRGLIIFFELIGFALLGSSVLLLDALSSLLDILFSLFLLLFIRMAAKPPDEEHPLGHGRYEPIAGLQLGLVLFVIGSVMAFEQLMQLGKPLPQKEVHMWGWAIPLCAVAVYEICFRILSRGAKRMESPALLADAVHYRIDGLSSLFALISLSLGAAFPEHYLFFDHLGALSIALFMIGTGLFAARKNLHQLIDRAPDKRYFDLVRMAAMRIDEVMGTEKLRLQMYGPDVHIAIDIEVDPYLCVEKAHGVTQRVRDEIKRSWPAVKDVIVHVEPFGLM